MKNMTRFATPLIAVAMMTGATMLQAQSTNQTVQNTQQTSTFDWNTPPAGTEQAQQGYRDGIQAAKLDKAANRKVDAKASFLYTHPPVKKGAARDEYLSSFEAGYKAAVDHSSGM